MLNKYVKLYLKLIFLSAITLEYIASIPTHLKLCGYAVDQLISTRISWWHLSARLH